VGSQAVIAFPLLPAVGERRGVRPLVGAQDLSDPGCPGANYGWETGTHLRRTFRAL
jgi:hypothetical protein